MELTRRPCGPLEDEKQLKKEDLNLMLKNDQYNQDCRNGHDYVIKG